MVSNRNFLCTKESNLKEIERDILDFVWNKKKHEINKQLLMSCESNGRHSEQNRCTASELASKSIQTSLR